MQEKIDKQSQQLPLIKLPQQPQISQWKQKPIKTVPQYHLKTLRQHYKNNSLPQQSLNQIVQNSQDQQIPTIDLKLKINALLNKEFSNQDQSINKEETKSFINNENYQNKSSCDYQNYSMMTNQMDHYSSLILNGSLTAKNQINPKTERLNNKQLLRQEEENAQFYNWLNKLKTSSVNSTTFKKLKQMVISSPLNSSRNASPTLSQKLKAYYSKSPNRYGRRLRKSKESFDQTTVEQDQTEEKIRIGKIKIAKDYYKNEDEQDMLPD